MGRHPLQLERSRMGLGNSLSQQNLVVKNAFNHNPKEVLPSKDAECAKSWRNWSADEIVRLRSYQCNRFILIQSKLRKSANFLYLIHYP